MAYSARSEHPADPGGKYGGIAEDLSPFLVHSPINVAQVELVYSICFQPISPEGRKEGRNNMRDTNSCEGNESCYRNCELGYWCGML